MPIRMIVTDLDGTLLRSDKTVSDYSTAVLNQCKERGIVTAFATARPECGTRRLQEKFAPDYVLADNGACIHHAEEIIRYLPISKDARDSLLQKFLTSKEVAHITAGTGNCVYANCPPWEADWNIIYTDFSEPLGQDVVKFSVECADNELLRTMLHNYHELHFYSNSGEDWHQIMHRDATKQNAISYIADLLSFSLNEVLAFGDDFNDIEMLEGCGIGVAMANAGDKVKSAANFVCDSNDNDGIAKWLEQYILNNR